MRKENGRQGAKTLSRCNKQPDTSGARRNPKPRNISSKNRATIGLHDNQGSDHPDLLQIHPEMPPTLDAWLQATDQALRTLWARPRAQRRNPAADAREAALPPAERQLAGALMRVNHVGEVCAQALYAAQALATRDPKLRAHFDAAAREETDHLAWTRERLDELGARPSLLNPLWYAGAFGIGLAAGALGGDRMSLGFVVETERQVEAHLASHLRRLPAEDLPSRAIVAQMQTDEARHADEAAAAGAADVGAPVRSLMRFAARVMTTVAHRV